MELDPIIAKIEASRKELLDLGLRNPLLNYRLLKSRGVEVIDELPSAVFDILVRNGRAMSFLPRPDDDRDYDLGQPRVRRHGYGSPGGTSTIACRPTRRPTGSNLVFSTRTTLPTP